ncbi:hypothetical protein NIE88_01060 [Sporolactobacillus shoreicorticis]|uniref:Uncharacterized protein n=1 Tax=Sporolactobacillus shoreicorticis TaxID=1923877 RepID=A0ABW5S4E0_9BACL|nr:hypothetical protein [Sporolactobacillus shoreicorticis]MCO7124371.1 hypothetical protein [Sporolactobacillus shoreicorticis]
MALQYRTALRLWGWNKKNRSGTKNVYEKRKRILNIIVMADTELLSTEEIIQIRINKRMSVNLVRTVGVKGGNGWQT